MITVVLYIYIYIYIYVYNIKSLEIQLMCYNSCSLNLSTVSTRENVVSSYKNGNLLLIVNYFIKLGQMFKK